MRLKALESGSSERKKMHKVSSFDLLMPSISSVRHTRPSVCPCPPFRRRRIDIDDAHTERRAYSTTNISRHEWMWWMNWRLSSRATSLSHFLFGSTKRWQTWTAHNMWTGESCCLIPYSILFGNYYKELCTPSFPLCAHRPSIALCPLWPFHPLHFHNGLGAAIVE